MRLVSVLFLGILLAACEPPAPGARDCVEFDHLTVRDDKPVKCRMVFCEGVTATGHYSGGAAALWCE